MIPKDPNMLVSYINTQIRDHYKTLEECCEALEISQEELKQKLKTVDYCYDETTHQFV